MSRAVQAAETKTEDREGHEVDALPSSLPAGW